MVNQKCSLESEQQLNCCLRGAEIFIGNTNLSACSINNELKEMPNCVKYSDVVENKLILTGS